MEFAQSGGLGRPVFGTGGGAVLLFVGMVSSAAADPPSEADKGPAQTAQAAQPAEEITVTAKRLEEVRIGIEPQIGASTFSFSNQAIENLPGGDNTPLNQVILQAPGVAQDSFGQIHVRNEHGLLQYRINGVILPEGISLFGQTLPTRIADSVDLITGALPSEYGLRSSGIIDLHTKSGTFQPGGSVAMYGGSHGWIEPSAEYGGSVGRFNYFVSGDFTQNDIGIENPTSSYNAIHDRTEQGHGFAYLEYLINDTSKVSAILGTFRGQFLIPNNPGQVPAFTVNGITGFDSSKLSESQTEINHYGVVSYLKTAQDFDYQISAFTRYSSLSFEPDALGDLLFNGIAQTAYRRDIGNGLQAEGSYRIASNHTLRSGLIIQVDRAIAQTNSLVLPVDGAGAELAPPADAPFSITDNNGKTGWTYSIYIQDEWRVTPTVTLNYGGRFDVVDEFTHENQISPRINAVWKATPSTTVHAGYANYFTPPPFELISSTSVGLFAATPNTATPAVTQNSPVKAERSHYFDVGVEQQILPGLKAGIDIYYKYARNLIDEGQFGAPIILTPFNYHIGQNKGVELSASYDRDNVSAYANIAVAEQKAEGISSAQFNFAPDELAFIADNAIHTDHDQTVTISGGASYLWSGTRFGFDLLVGSGLRSGFANTSALPTYEQVNLSVSHRFEQAPGGPLEVRLDLINLFDQIYQIRTGTGVGVGASQFGPRRSALVGVRKFF